MEDFSTFYAPGGLYASHRAPVAPHGGVWNLRSNSLLNHSSMRTARHCFSTCRARPYWGLRGEANCQRTEYPEKGGKRAGVSVSLNSISGCVQK